MKIITFLMNNGTIILLLSITITGIIVTVATKAKYKDILDSTIIGKSREQLTEEMAKEIMSKTIKYSTFLIVTEILVAIFISTLRTIAYNAGSYDIVLMLISLVVAHIFIRIYILLRNKIIIGREDAEEIYIRDIPASYSPAVVSYLYNQKLESKKEITATILNLISKKVILPQIDENNKFVFRELEGNKIELDSDELYIYEWTTNKRQFKVSEWRDLVLEEYYKYKFSRTNGISLFILTFKVYFTFIIVLVFMLLFGGSEVLQRLQLGQYIGSTIGVLFAFMLISLPYDIISNIFFKSINKYSNYTKKGAQEMEKWNKFKKFMQDLTLINEAGIDRIIVLERYLAYSMVLDINNNYNQLHILELRSHFKHNIFDSINDFIENVPDLEEQLSLLNE